jgi:nucleotide-binding universal stress UspA family protein
MSNRPIVIVPVDGSRETEWTVDFASSVARRAAADLHMVHVLSRAGGRWIGPEAETGVRARLRALRPLVEREGLRLRTITLRGRPESVIPAYAQLNAASMIVVSRNYGTPSFWRNSALANRISRSSPVPVIVLPSSAPVEPAAPAAPLSLKRIMVAVDFNVASAIGVRTAADLARRHGAHLTMVHAMTWPPAMVFSGGEAARLLRGLPAEASAIAERLKRKIRAFRVGDVESLVVTGVASRRIVEAATSNADLIVMGVAPRTSFDEAAFGSTLRAVLRRATIPVLVVPVVAGAEPWLGDANGADAFSFAVADDAVTPLAAQ